MSGGEVGVCGRSVLIRCAINAANGDRVQYTKKSMSNEEFHSVTHPKYCLCMAWQRFINNFRKFINLRISGLIVFELIAFTLPAD